MKYRNIKTVIDNIKFDSKKESYRYLELKQLQKQGKISDLTLQPKFILEINGCKICNYIADFSYYVQDSRTKAICLNRVVEDVKGMKTAVYRLKKKLMKACHGIDILET